MLVYKEQYFNDDLGMIGKDQRSPQSRTYE